MNNSKVTLVNGTILTVDEKNSFYSDGGIVVSEDTIEKIGADVTDSMVGGQWLMRERNVLSLNTDSKILNAREASRAILEFAGLL